MKRKQIIWAALVLAVLLTIPLLNLFMQREEHFTSDALAYLQSQKFDQFAQDAWPEQINPFKSNSSGYVTDIELNANESIDLLISLVETASQAQRVDTVPDLNPPRVTCGDRFAGSCEKLYYIYPNSRKIVEFTLDRTASMTLALYAAPYGFPYPEVRDYYKSELEDYLQDLLPEDGEDWIEVTDGGYPDALDIRTQETLDRYLDCVRNCSSIQDETDNLCGPWAIPPRIQVGGEDMCNYECAYYISPSTGRPIIFYFQEEDSQALREYIETLAGWDESSF